MVASDAASISSSSSVRPSVQFRVRALAVDGRREAEARHDAPQKALLRSLGVEVLERPLGRSSRAPAWRCRGCPEVLRSVSRRPGLDWVVV